MKTILMMYLILFKGYSVMRLCDYCDKWAKSDGWQSCNTAMEFDYGHNGAWGTGDTPQEAVYKCYMAVKK